MKKAGILTINDDNNYGNRLQNYATQEVLKKRDLKVETIKNISVKTGISYLKSMIKLMIKKFMFFLPISKRYHNFMNFDKNINYSQYIINENHIPSSLANEYDYFITGSDQVWNPNFNRMTKIDFLEFAPKEKRNSLSASFGIEKIPNNLIEKAKEGLEGLNNISVREERGKQIIEELTSRKDVEVLIDPTMMLEKEEWEKVAKKPKMLKSKKYILNYFLGEMPLERKQEIEKLSKENDCEIINILDKKSPFYTCGPSEFIYLEKNAFFICTDSFHSCAFAILFQKPFMVFERIKQGSCNMNSRIETILKTFCLEDRYYTGKIEKEKLVIDYTKANERLKGERKKFEKFLDKIFRDEDKKI